MGHFGEPTPRPQTPLGIPDECGLWRLQALGFTEEEIIRPEFGLGSGIPGICGTWGRTSASWDISGIRDIASLGHSGHIAHSMQGI